MILQPKACNSIIDSQLGMILLYLKNNASLFNRYIKYFFSTRANDYTMMKSLCTQCVQTSNMINYVLSTDEEYLFEEGGFKKLDFNYAISRKDDIITTFDNGKINNISTLDIDAFIDKILLEFESPMGVNFGMHVPHTEDEIIQYFGGKSRIVPIQSFPGHRFNIIRAPADEGENRPIYVTQSSLHEYILKVWATNDITDIKEMLKIYLNLILSPDKKFKRDDIALVKQVFGSPSVTDSKGKSLLGRTKPSMIDISITHFTSETIIERFDMLSKYINKYINFYKNTIPETLNNFTNYDSKVDTVDVALKLNKLIKDSGTFYIRACKEIACSVGNRAIEKLKKIYELYNPKHTTPQSIESLRKFVIANMELITSVIDVYLKDLYEFLNIVDNFNTYTNPETTPYSKGDFIYFESIPVCKGKLPYASSASNISNCISPMMQETDIQLKRIKSQCRQTYFGYPQQTIAQFDLKQLSKTQKQAARQRDRLIRQMQRGQPYLQV
jgi:hypothetical protein